MSTKNENYVVKVAKETERILKNNPNPFLGKTKKEAFQIGVEVALFDRYGYITEEKNTPLNI